MKEIARDFKRRRKTEQNKKEKNKQNKISWKKCNVSRSLSVAIRAKWDSIRKSYLLARCEQRNEWARKKKCLWLFSSYVLYKRQIKTKLKRRHIIVKAETNKNDEYRKYTIYVCVFVRLILISFYILRNFMKKEKRISNSCMSVIATATTTTVFSTFLQPPDPFN